MPIISKLSAASATSPNWLKEAQESLAASENPSGLLGALHFARYKPGSLSTVLAKNQAAAANLALIVQGTSQSQLNVVFSKASAAMKKRMTEKLSMARRLNPHPVNFTPPKKLDSLIHFANGSTIDTVRQIMTLSNGQQVDIRTGKEYVNEVDIIRLASGSYIDTANKIMVLSNGTKIDTVTGLSITV
jgi:hypothetical protein